MVNPPDQNLQDPLLKVCALLNKHGADYIIIGGHALILHGLVRTTEDVDILIREDTENYARVIEALSEMEDHAAAELRLEDFEENLVIKVADEVEVDISRRAWTVSYQDAVQNVNEVEIDGVRIPYLALEDLVASKQTYRDRDRADLEGLQRLQRNAGNPIQAKPTIFQRVKTKFQKLLS